MTRNYDSTIRFLKYNTKYMNQFEFEKNCYLDAHLAVRLRSSCKRWSMTCSSVVSIEQMKGNGQNVKCL